MTLWDPSNLNATLTAWQQGGTGVAVAKWSDSSANSNHLNQGTAGDQPAITTLNGHNILDFNDSENDHMDYGDLDAMDVGTGDFYTFIVINPDKGSTNMALLAKHSGSDDYLLRISSGNKVQQYIGASSGGTVLTGSTSLSPSTTYIVAGYRSGTSSIVRLDGSQDGTTTNENSLSNARTFHVAGQATAGTAANYDGKIAEIIMGGGSIADGEIQKVEGYLQRRFALSSLPATHTYVDFAPAFGLVGNHNNDIQGEISLDISGSMAAAGVTGVI